MKNETELKEKQITITVNVSDLRSILMGAFTYHANKIVKPRDQHHNILKVIGDIETSVNVFEDNIKEGV